MWPRTTLPRDKYRPFHLRFGCFEQRKQLACTFRKPAGTYVDNNGHNTTAITLLIRQNEPDSLKGMATRVSSGVRCTAPPTPRTLDPWSSPSNVKDDDVAIQICLLRDNCHPVLCRILELLTWPQLPSSC